ncbi:hypothetical protein [Fibrivirga algicola]|uniref:Uncharacterized protein n=1 Tax=Fibrivirga algicola TaxID=2950420 RepID=A0ABX0QD90_9BACT|nr:hypothetical protein [Fibrivirga algicola]ARK10848.1 hypothetical protein A6C57_11225 [Fibrella sp. ES10-3-2-2]NID09908.1 hypothetical protein [Fibrivirga algicola]
MKTIRLYMILQWVLFLPILLPLCMVFGALRGAVLMAERVIDQMSIDISYKPTGTSVQPES